MEYEYGLLKYGTLNFGDEIQSIAARQFLPRVDRYVDRDNLNNVRSSRKIKLIMNGWFMHRPENWPPSPDIKPLFVSFHISSSCAKDLTSEESIRYFKKYEPIGCRDYYTLNLLRRKGVNAYFSGCLTLTLTLKANNKKLPKKSDEILLVDLDREIIQNIPRDILDRTVVLGHVGLQSNIIRSIYRFFRDSDNPIAKLLRGSRAGLLLLNMGAKIFTSDSKKFRQAEELLLRYSRAKLVVTSRLHCALPCLAFGTPVIFVHRNLDDPRFGGILEYLRSYSVKDFIGKMSEIEWDNPEPNPKSIKSIRENLIKVCENFIKDREY